MYAMLLDMNNSKSRRDRAKPTSDADFGAGVPSKIDIEISFIERSYFFVTQCNF